MAREFKLYWSSLELYEKCPRRFLWSRGFGNIDVGGGPGRRKPVPEQRSDHHRVMGIVIQDVIEDFYNHELWKDPKAQSHKGYLMRKLEDMVQEKFHYITQKVGRNGKPKFYLPYGTYEKTGRVPNPNELLEVCLEGVRGFMRTMKANKLLGPYARAEVDLVGWIDDHNPVGGRADLIIRRDDTGTSIIDGKNSKSKGKYTDPDQLRWYAMCFYLAYNRMPDRLGFCYYRYPYDKDTGETGVEWVEFTKDDIKGLARRAVDVRNAMDKGQFDPTPSPKNCAYCDYESLCPERLAQKKKNSRPRKPKDIEVKTQDKVGVFELGFDE